MKRDLKFKKIMDVVTGLKIFCMTSSVFYFFFCIWRFIPLPLTEKLTPFTDILLIPIKAGGRNTVCTFGEHTLDVGYIIVSILFFFFAFVFWAFQKYVPIAETQEEIEEIKFKRKQEEDMNRELQNAYLASIEVYKQFTIFFRLKFYFANTAYLDRDKVNLGEIRENAYREAISALRADYPAMKFERRDNCVFCHGRTFERFDLVISSVLDQIKLQKDKWAKDGILIDFLIVIDSQKSDIETEISYKTCMSIANLEYNNKAVVTLTFKQRYDLLNFKKFKTDYLCNFHLDNMKSEERELFTLKSRPKHI